MLRIIKERPVDAATAKAASANHSAKLMNPIATALLLLTVGGISASAVLAFWWAGGKSQFEELERGAMSVFDADEAAALHPPPDAAQEREF